MNNLRDDNHASDNGFEREDLGTKPVFAFMLSLVALAILIYYVIWGVFYFLDAYQRKTQLENRRPMIQAESNTREIQTRQIQRFPEPRLEENERTELDGFRYGEEEKLNSYGWTDQKAGVTHIPIERAMQRIAQQGLSTTPKTGTVPLAPVNLARAAAARADSNTVAPETKPTGKKQ